MLIFLGVVLLLGFFVAGIYNSLVAMRQRVREGFSTMDVYLKQRYDLIPNLVETVKGYAFYEKEALESVVLARSKAMGAQTVEEIGEANNGLTQALGRLFALAEAYPDLKANESFMDLQNQLAVVEGEIANSRRYYNGVVREFNTQRDVFPNVFVANLFGFFAEPYFEIDERQRENVVVDFK